jgi:hypothetical protein
VASRRYRASSAGSGRPLTIEPIVPSWTCGARLEMSCPPTLRPRTELSGSIIDDLWQAVPQDLVSRSSVPVRCQETEIAMAQDVRGRETSCNLGEAARRVEH